MLTGDLVRARQKGESIVPQYLRGAAVDRVREIARAFAGIFEGHVGAAREEIDAALAAVDVPARDRVAALGLRKLLEDRAEFASGAAEDPESLRNEVFLASARAHRELDVIGAFDRVTVLRAIADARSTTVEAIERALFADLKSREVLKSFEPIGPERLIERYNLALAQAMLFKATRVVVTVSNDDPLRLRRLFRAARFHGLLHIARAAGPGETRLEIDGPFSLFDAVQRYGLKLALFLPNVVALDRFSLVAELRWGKERAVRAFTITEADALTVESSEPPANAPGIDAFVDAFTRLGSAWNVAPARRVFALPGEIACVPDLVFNHRKTGEEVYLELFGFWSRAAVWQRVELLRKGAPLRLILAVGKQLRVSEEVLDEDACGEVYVFKQAMSPRAVLARLDGER